MEPLTSYLFPFVFHLSDLLFYFLKDFPDFIFYTFNWYFKISAILFLIFKNSFLITVHYFVWVFLLILWMHLFLFSPWGYQSMFCFLSKIILLSAFSLFSLNHIFSVCFYPSLLILGSVFMFECLDFVCMSTTCPLVGLTMEWPGCKSDFFSSLYVGMEKGVHSRWFSGQEYACQCRRCRRCRFYPWLRKIPWRRKWQPTPVFLPGESHGQRSLVDYSP